METIKPELTNFLPPGENFLQIALIESLEYAEELARMLPDSKIYVIKADAYELDNLNVTGNIEKINIDYTETPLPLEKNSLDYIIGDLLLENVGNPQDIASGLGTYLKETGILLTSFRNIRYIGVVKNLMEGDYFFIARRLYAKREFERLLAACFYKDVRMKGQKGDIDEKGRDLIKRLEKVDFENIDEEMEMAFYMVEAAKSMPEIRLLKSMYSKDTRRKLGKLVRRIEFDAGRKEAIVELEKLCQEESVFEEYLRDFIKQACFDYTKVLKILKL
ncbi:MAG: hypothetical protein J6O04_00780 [Selenomonadaceae bacterium]|nr:hypothetical protein [Selenomonadaceae bacterium]